MKGHIYTNNEHLSSIYYFLGIVLQSMLSKNLPYVLMYMKFTKSICVVIHNKNTFYSQFLPPWCPEDSVLHIIVDQKNVCWIDAGRLGFRLGHLVWN